MDSIGYTFAEVVELFSDFKKARKNKVRLVLSISLLMVWIAFVFYEVYEVVHAYNNTIFESDVVKGNTCYAWQC